MRLRTRSSSMAMNVGDGIQRFVRRSEAPAASAAAAVACTSMSKRISVWSQTKPIGTTRNRRTPAAARSSYQVADVGADPRLRRAPGALVARSRTVSMPRGRGHAACGRRHFVGVASPSSMTRCGRLCAVNTTVVARSGRSGLDALGERAQQQRVRVKRIDRERARIPSRERRRRGGVGTCRRSASRTAARAGCAIMRDDAAAARVRRSRPR